MYVPVQGTAVPGKIAAPASLSFGKVTVGSSTTKTFNVENKGLGVLNGNVAILGAPFSVISGAGNFTLSEGQSISVTVQFAPTSAKSVKAKLTITSDDPSHPVIKVAVSGK
ncbi:MAG: choice-of-anchor D domain-containing protein [Candidatus Binatales bacterium]